MNDYILPFSMLMGGVTFALVARWYLYPWLKQRPIADALRPLLLLHSLRYIGLTFLVAGVTAAPLDPRFAVPAAYGDLLSAALAFVALAALTYRWKSAHSWVWAFNIVGSLDLVIAVTQGFRHTPDGDLGAAFFIPALIVPALLVSHVVIFQLLWRTRDTMPSQSRDDGDRVPVRQAQRSPAT
jgi:hypothetical protein